MSSSMKGARAAAVTGLAGAAILAGCAAPAAPAGSGAGAVTSSAAPASPGSGTPAPGAASTPAQAAASPGAPAAVPVLGRLAGVFANGRGFGQVRPAEVFNGGDPTGLVTGITWSSWGGAQASGTGTGYFDPPDQPVADSKKEQATIVAFRLGTCGGKLMYQAVEWYFPESGQSFSPSHYENVCTGSFVPSS